MSKMYYAEDEVASKLGINQDDLAEFTKEHNLRVFQDGAKKMFLTQEIDALSPDTSDTQDTQEIEISPSDTSDMDVISLSDTTGTPVGTPSKNDTVFTAEGISIFDDDDLEIEAADPLAQTLIAPSLEDQIALDGAGSGSGLLDLTRESDETSIGAAILGNIDIGSSIGAGIIEDDAEEPAIQNPKPVFIQSTSSDLINGSSGFFGGIAIGASLITMLLVAVAMPFVVGNTPSYASDLKANLTTVVAGMVILMIITGVIGYFAGKSIADRRAAMSMR